MNKRALLLLALPVVIAIGSTISVHANITAKDIVRRYIKARGGMEKIKAIRTLVYYGAERVSPSGEKWRPAMVRARPYYFLVGDPAKASTTEYAEGNDGSHWEFFRSQGLVLRTTGAPAAAIRHTAYFDDEMVMSEREPGFKVTLMGRERIGNIQTYKLRVNYPDGFTSYNFIDTKTWLLVARRFTAPVHAFGEPVTSETRFSNWKRVNGVLYWHDLREVDMDSGKTLNQGSWESIKANLELPPEIFSPPDYEKTPLNRMLNSVYAARGIPENALGWYLDFRNNPQNAGIDTSLGMSSVGYQVLKTGAVKTAIMLLEANAKDNPNVAHAQFGLGRAYMVAGRIENAITAFQKALKIDPKNARAANALEEARRKLK